MNIYFCFNTVLIALLCIDGNEEILLLKNKFGIKEYKGCISILLKILFANDDLKV